MFLFKKIEIIKTYNLKIKFLQKNLICNYYTKNFEKKIIIILLHFQNWFGEITSSDNKEFLIHDAQHKIRAKELFTVRFFVKFNRAQTIPSVTIVRFNGKTVCDNGANSSILEAINTVETSGIVMRPTSTNRPYEKKPTISNPNL